MTRIAFWSLFIALVASSAPAGDEPPRFERDVLPILRARCLKCHGTANRKGGLSLRSPASMLEGGDNGPALTPGKADESLILEQIESGAMPPGKAAKLSEAEVATLKSWIGAGAPADATSVDASAPEDEPAHWAFRPPARPVVPPPPTSANTHNPIDAFLLAKLDATGLTFSPEADRRTLIRRATFDLWGLPPSPAEIDAFLADTAEGAFERLIDRLLASPRYGERWGRHWLDLAGYADSEGILDADHIRSAAWRYRDWVIRAINADLPYDEFLRQQIAGDEFVDYWSAYKSRETLPETVVDALIATGYLRCASDTSRPDFVNIKNAAGYYYQTLEDTVKIVATSTLGLTLQCAKCHTHKYDPVTQAEYYRVQAIFMSGYRPSQWVAQADRKRFEATEKQEVAAKAHNARIDAAIKKRQDAINALRTGFGDRLFAERLAALPAAIREDVRGAIAQPAAKRNEVQRYLAGKFANDLQPPADVLAKLLAQNAPRDRDVIQVLEASNTADERTRRAFPEIRAFYDLPGVAKTPILQRGDYLHPDREVPPGALPAVATPEPFRWSPPSNDAPTSGRRKAFAEWLTQPGHPLTARVLVNRLWLHHFGEGIVATPDNFGVKGTPPTHPALLDWLATELVARGWSMKAMHRLMMTSTAYRQASRVEPKRDLHARSIDPDNRLLWKQRMRRMEAEALRDAILDVSGTINLAMGGSPVPLQVQPDGEIVAPASPIGTRRSIYLLVRRSQPLTFLQIFDQPVIETNCTRRSTSTVSSQALSLLNSDFLNAQAGELAARVLKESPDDPAGRAVELAFGRPMSESEITLFRDYIAEQVDRKGRSKSAALTDICQMIFSSNEFAYVD